MDTSSKDPMVEPLPGLVAHRHVPKCVNAYIPNPEGAEAEPGEEDENSAVLPSLSVGALCLAFAALLV